MSIDAQNLIPPTSKKTVSSNAVIVWFAAALFACFQFCTQVITGPMTRDLMEYYDLTAVGIGYVVSSFFYMYLILQLPAGIILDRYPSRFILSIACFVCGLGAILMGVTNNLYLFVLARMLCGMGSAFGFIGTMRVIRNYISLPYISLFIGFTEMLGFFITAFCEYSVSYFLPQWGFQKVLYVFGAIGAVVALIIYIAHSPMIAPKHQFAPPVKHDNKISETKELLFDKQMWILGLIAFSFFSLVTAYAALWAVPSLMNIHHLTLSDATKAVSVIFIGIAVGGPSMGFVYSRITKHSQLIFWSGIICAISIFIINFCNLHIYLIYFFLFVAGVFSCCYLLCFVVANEIVPVRLNGACMGLINMITMSSAMVMQPVMGYLVALDGSLGIINGAPVYSAEGYKRAGLALVFLYLFASFLTTRLSITNTATSEMN